MKNKIFTIILFGLLSTSFAQSLSDKNSTTATAIFAGGCFWCIEADFEKLNGVSSAVSGYIGGTVKNPTYEQVSAHNTGHYEAIKVNFNPQVVSYKELVDYFWHHIDPTDAYGQFCDKGSPYKTAIFWQDEEQKKVAESSLQELQNSKKLDKFGGVKTAIIKATEFWPAEEYHQDYYKKNPVRYKYYRISCGRDNRVNEIWGNK